jgi:hypothetical protein
MSDIIDDANDRAARDLAIAVQAARQSNGLEVAPCGQCLNCGNVVKPPLRWCDADCLADWQARNKRRGVL